MATAKAMQALGAEVERSNGAVAVKGQGVGGLRAPSAPLDFGNSGTGSRLMLGAVAGHDMQVEFTGDASLCRRPMERVLAPLNRHGACRSTRIGRCHAAAVVRGTAGSPPHRLRPAGAVGASEVGDPSRRHACARPHHRGRAVWRARDHTERMLGYFGAELIAEDRGQRARAVTICGDAELHGARDCRAGRSELGRLHDRRRADLAALGHRHRRTCCSIRRGAASSTPCGRWAPISSCSTTASRAARPCGDLRVRSSALKGVHVPPERAPSMIDEYPVLACLAAFAEGETRMQGLAELKVKESDRLERDRGRARRLRGRGACRGRRPHCRRRRRGRRRRPGRDAYGSPHRHGVSDARAWPRANPSRSTTPA